MKKFHWGHAILIFFIFYVGTLAFVLFKSTTVNHSLVVKDYYNHDLNYQKKYDKIQNFVKHNIGLEVRWDEKNSSLILEFNNAASRSGNIKLYNPAHTSKDLSSEFAAGKESIYSLRDLNLSPGRWKVQLDWTEEDIPFFTEKEIYISMP